MSYGDYAADALYSYMRRRRSGSVGWNDFIAQWSAIGLAYWQRMFGVRLRGGKYLREYAGMVIR